MPSKTLNAEEKLKEKNYAELKEPVSAKKKKRGFQQYCWKCSAYTHHYDDSSSSSDAIAESGFSDDSEQNTLNDTSLTNLSQLSSPEPKLPCLPPPSPSTIKTKPFNPAVFQSPLPTNSNVQPTLQHQQQKQHSQANVLETKPIVQSNVQPVEVTTVEKINCVSLL